MKKRCKDCKWCKYREFAALGIDWGWFCKLKDKVSRDSVGHKITDFSEGDCPNYHRKWWKFERPE